MDVDVDTELQEMRAERTVQKSGNSTVVPLPPAILREAGFNLGDEVNVTASFDGQEIRIRKENHEDDQPTHS